MHTLITFNIRENNNILIIAMYASYINTTISWNLCVVVGYISRSNINTCDLVFFTGESSGIYFHQ